MAAKPFSAPYRKVKDVTVYIYEDTLTGMPQGFDDRRAVYMDPRDDTSLVIAVPDYVAAFMGTWVKVSKHSDTTIEIEKQDKGACFIRSYQGLDALKNNFKLLMDAYRNKVAEAVEEKVIVIQAAYKAIGVNGRTVDRTPSFADQYEGALVGFNYAIRWRINGELYDRSSESSRLWKVGHGDDFRGGVVITWTEAAEQACEQFHQGVKAIGQRMHDFLTQDAEELRLQLESRRNPLLGFPTPAVQPDDEEL